LIALRRKFPELKSGFRVPLYPITPVAAILLNLFLAFYQFEFDARAWYIAVVWLVVGLLIYFVGFHKNAVAEQPQVLEVRQPQPQTRAAYRVLLPLHNPDHVVPLMRLTAPIAKAHDGEIIVLGVVDIPINIPVHEGMRFVRHKTPLLKKAIHYGQEFGVPTRSAVRIAHQVHDGILRTAESEDVSLIVMGWKGYTSTRDRIMGEVTDKVVRQAPCDLITVKLMGDRPVERILIPTAGGPHASLASEYVGILQEQLGAEVSCCYVVPPGAAEHDRAAARQWIEKTIQYTPLVERAEMLVLEGRRVTPTLVKAAVEYDMLVIGASKEGVFSSVLFGEIPEKVARYSRTPVMIVKRHEGAVKTIVKRIMG
jgi:nucleotide-binding universal stress UspA family protein